ncbi:TPA: transcriptional regulator [Legionella pneumophila]|nr:transcriptional regulator [Legionella sp. MW5194]HAT7873611.1 transcriptional regulator [Legionella pneumophila]HAT9162380.1 transcriptional regulator [Legionella pneumophila subsp. pneumophila]HAT7982834.1 transcriptional regulator [Legionella pneumophila]HAT7987363.1 transcriptional regulator [Legionella pneumophila]
MILNDIVLYDNFFMTFEYKDNFMNKGPYQSFANRLISILKDRGYTASRSPNGICIKTLAEFTGASEQICRRYIRGDALPDYEKVKQLAFHLQINPGWLIFGEEGHAMPKKNEIDETLLHYILKQSHHLYPVSHGSNDDYADFVLGLIKEVRAIDTSENNLLKIIDLAIGSISSYEEQRKKHSHAV